MKLIDPNVITMTGRITDAELKARLLREAIEQAGWMGEDGKPLKGVEAKINRTGGRAGNGGWEVSVTRDLTKSGQALLTAGRADT
jgi:hypothetical protein